MKLLDQIHEGYVFDRRTRVLSDVIASMLPEHARLLDVGCGDGRIARMIQERRPDVEIEGIDVFLRPITHIPVTEFDGTHVPFTDGSFDAVMFVDVLHHTDDPVSLLREAARVTKRFLLLKDHTRDGFLAGPTLHFMDWVGNERHGVAIPANYWQEERWRDTFARLNLAVECWSGDLPLYPWWASWLFGRSLHFVARLTKSGA